MSSHITTWLLVGSFVFLVSAGLLRVWVHQDTVQLGYQLSASEKRAAELNDLVHQLEIELTAELSPDRLAQHAGPLGLMPAASAQIMGRVTPTSKDPKGSNRRVKP